MGYSNGGRTEDCKDFFYFLAVDVDIFVEATYSAKCEGPELLYKKFNIHMTEYIIKI